MKQLIALILAATSSLAILSAAAPAPEPGPDVPGDGPALARAMLARCAKIRTLRVAMAGELAGESRAGQSSGSLVFRRPDGLRLEMKGQIKLGGMRLFDHDLAIAVEGNRWVEWSNAQHQVVRGNMQEALAGHWDAFANPAGSLLALLCPGDEDRALLEKTFLPRVKHLPPEIREGVKFERLRARGAYGAVLEFWLEPESHAPRRILITAPPEAAGGKFEYRIEIQAIDQPLDAALFHLQPPRGLADARDPARHEREAPAPAPRADPRPALRALQARAAASPRDAKLQLQLAGALFEAGRAAQATAAIRKALAAAPSLPVYGEAWRLAAENSQPKLAISVFISGLEKHGEALLDPENDESPDFAQAARDAEMVPAAAAALEKILARAKDPWSVRAALLHLHLTAAALEPAIPHWLALVDPGPDNAAFPPEREKALRAAMAEMTQAGWPWPEAREGEFLAALRRAERRLPPELLPGIADAYLRFESPVDVDRLLQTAGVELPAVSVLIEIGSAMKRKGDHRRAEVLFRRALLNAAAARVDYGSLFMLAETPDAKEILGPVFRQLAESEGPADPLTGALWLYLAEDYRQAADAGEQYLASPAGSPDETPALQRFAAAVLALRAARKTGEQDRCARLAALAVAELPFAAVEGSGRGALATQALDAARGGEPFAALFVAAAAADPLGAWRWLCEHSPGPGELDHRALSQALAQMAPVLERRRVSRAAMAAQLLRAGRSEEAEAMLVHSLRENPERVDAALVARLAAWREDPRPLAAALEEAVKGKPQWKEGIVALAACRRQQGDPEGAAAVLAAAAGRLKAPGLYRELAESEWRAGRRAAAIARLREALRALPAAAAGVRELSVLLARMLEGSAATREAAAVWRQLGAAARGAPAVEAAAGLKRCGCGPEALRLLERAVRGEPADTRRATTARYALAKAYLEQTQPLKTLALYPSLAARARAGRYAEQEDDEEGESYPLPLVARALEMKGERPAARHAYEGAIMRASASPDDLDAYLQLARRDDALAEARDVLTLFARSREGLSDPMLAVCRGMLDEAEGKPGAAAVFRRVVHPEGAPFPHASPAAQLASRRLAALAEREGRPEEARPYARWAEAMRLLGDAEDDELPPPYERDLNRARDLFPECPCITLRMAVRLPADGAAPAPPLPGPERERVMGELDRLLPVAAAVLSCPSCTAALRALQPGISLAMPAWLDRHRDDARAYLLASCAAGEEWQYGQPGFTAEHAEAYLRRAVTLDPQLTAAWEDLLKFYLRQPGRKTDLLEAAEKVAAQRPEDPRAQWLLALAYDGAGRRRRAAAARWRARQLGADATAPGWRDEMDWRVLPHDTLADLFTTLYRSDAIGMRWLLPRLPDTWRFAQPLDAPIRFN
jgi:hypothetical protein